MTDVADRLEKLLGHKDWEWRWQVGLSVAGKTDGLENRFYVAKRGDAFISNVCTFEKDGVGILGHVWTPPEERRKGLCNAIFEKLMAEFKSRKGRLMLLGTGFDTPPYHIYRKFGFEGFFEGSGLMRYAEDPKFESKYFASAPTTVVEPTWQEWPKLNALFAQPEEYVKTFAFGHYFKTDAEQCYLFLLHEMANNPRVSAKLLRSDKTGAIVGVAWVMPQRIFPQAMILDLTCHPKHADGYAKLLASMTWPDVKVFALVDSGKRAKLSALKAAGFEPAGILHGMLPKRDEPTADLHLYEGTEMIIDAHHHLERRPNYTRDLLKTLDKLNIDHVVVAGLPDYYQWSSNDEIEKAIKEAKGRILGFAWVNLGVDRPSKVDEFKERGFTGLKFTMPKYDYDHGSLYPIYERAEQLGMPGLFHFGVVAFRPGHEARDVSSSRMRPIMIDPLCRAFSKWIIIGAHLGNPWYREACMACRWHVNLYFDLTGSTLKQYKPADLGPYLWWRKDSRYRDPQGRDAWEKILFGSDVAAEEIHDVMNDYHGVMDHFKLSPAIRRKIWGDTAARILGVKK